MRRVIVKEIRVTDGNRVILGYDVHRGRRQWWAHDVDTLRTVRHQDVIFVSSRREATALFWDLYEALASLWFDEHVSMFRPREPEGLYGGAFRDIQDFWHYTNPTLVSLADRY